MQPLAKERTPDHRSRSSTEALRNIYRIEGYLCAAIVGMTIPIARGFSENGWFEKLTATMAIVWIALMVLFVWLSSDDPHQRTKRLIKCSLTATLAIFVSTWVPLDYAPIPYPINSVLHFDLLDLSASVALVLFLCAEGVLYMRQRLETFGKAAIPAHLAGFLSFIVTLATIFRHTGI